MHRWGKLQTDGGRRGFASVTSVSLGNRALSLFFLLSWTKLLGKSYSSSSIFISIALNLKRNSKHRSLSSVQFPLFHIFNRPGWRNAFLQLNRKRAIPSKDYKKKASGWLRWEKRRAGKMGINERAINRVNGRRHAILARRRVVDRLTDTLDELHLGRLHPPPRWSTIVARSGGGGER